MAAGGQVLVGDDLLVDDVPAGEQRTTAEAELRATVDEELGDQAVRAELRVSAGLAGRVIVETAHQSRDAPAVAGGARITRFQ